MSTDDNPTETPSTETPSTQAAPVFEVVSGSPNAEELAAVVAVLSAAASSAGSEQPPVSDRTPVNGWSAYWRGMRGQHRPGPGAWRGF